MLYWAAIGAIFVCAIYGFSRLATADRKSMSEEEYEAAAQRSSGLGAAVGVVQKVIDPSHHVEYIEEQRQRVEAESTESGDRPPRDVQPSQDRSAR
jgi:hypothetical protein